MYIYCNDIKQRYTYHGGASAFNGKKYLGDFKLTTYATSMKQAISNIKHQIRTQCGLATNLQISIDTTRVKLANGDAKLHVQDKKVRDFKPKNTSTISRDNESELKSYEVCCLLDTDDDTCFIVDAISISDAEDQVKSMPHVVDIIQTVPLTDTSDSTDVSSTYRRINSSANHVISRLTKEVTQKLDKILRQYVYEYDIDVVPIKSYHLIVDINFDVDSISSKELSYLKKQINIIAKDYNGVPSTMNVSHIVKTNSGLSFDIYL